MNNFLENEMNKFTFTENGALTNVSAGSAVLDYFALGGAFRNTNKDVALRIFKNSLVEDSLLTLKLMFYFRDIREGQGQRQAFRDQLVELCRCGAFDTVAHNFDRIVEFGRWDDLFVLLDTPLKQQVLDYIYKQLEIDFINMEAGLPVSLLGKWMKSENTSSKESVRIAKILRKGLFLSSKEYRQLLTHLRAAIKVVETYMSANQWGKIEYSAVPSQAMLKYRNAFKRQDEDRFEKYIESVKSGESKINAATLYPQQIVHDILQGKSDNVDVLWNALPDYITNKEENSIAVVDTSGSMCGTPIEVALSLGIYLAERAKGIYANKFITFSERPTMQSLEGNNIVEKVRNLYRASWDMNTNIERVFDVILNAAIHNNISVKEMLSKIYIISDMEFDSAVSGDVTDTLFNQIVAKYARHGYVMPKLVFWNVDARQQQVPMSMNDLGVQLVSGYSPTIFKALMSDKVLDAYALMLEVVNSKRYDSIVL